MLRFSKSTGAIVGMRLYDIYDRKFDDSLGGQIADFTDYLQFSQNDPYAKTNGHQFDSGIVVVAILLGSADNVVPSSLPEPFVQTRRRQKNLFHDAAPRWSGSIL